MLNYSYTHKFTEDEYVQLRSAFQKKTRMLRLLLAAIVGIACLFSAFTLLLGLVLLGLVALALFAPRLIRFGARSEYRRSNIDSHPMTFTLTDSGLSFDGVNELHQSCDWHNHIQWSEDNDWISIYAPGMQPFYISKSKAKDDGVYDAIITYSRRYGKNQEMKPRPATIPSEYSNLPLQLSSAHLPVSIDASPASIREIVFSLPHKQTDRYAILSVDQLRFMQALFESKGFILEYQTGTIDDHFRSIRDNLSVDEVVEAFTNYALSGGQAVPALEFQKVDLRTRWQKIRDFIALILQR